jgi:CheY-like chemotaxis protein
MMTSLASRGDVKIFKENGFSASFPKPATTKDYYHALKVLEVNVPTEEDFIVENELDDKEHQLSWPEETRILLVEDNMTNQIVANGILETFCLQADTANDGEEAIHALRESLKTQKYNLVLMDCQMPVLDGYEATEAIRLGKAGEENTNVTIVAMTANAMKGDKEKCIASGMDEYLAKPIHPETLKEMLLKVLKREGN